MTWWHKFGKRDLRPQPAWAIQYARHRDEWCREYFNYYWSLYQGYPKHVPVITWDPRNPPSRWAVKVEGSAYPRQLFPWLDTSLNSKDITDEDEYRDFCAMLSYPTGSNTLDPAVFVGAHDIRQYSGAYGKRMDKYKQAYRSGQPLLTKPDYITCPGGIYLPSRGPSKHNKWGVNASYHPGGHTEPSWISDHWGPESRPDVIPGDGKYTGGVVWDVKRDGPKPAQEEYNRLRYTVWL